MEKDHYNALKFVVKSAKDKKRISPEYIIAVSARVMHGTGKEYNVAWIIQDQENRLIIPLSSLLTEVFEMNA